MALVNYICKPDSSEDLSSPENYGLDHTEVAFAGGEGGGSASSSRTMNSDHQQNHQGFVFYPSNETIEDHSSLMDFNTLSFLSFDHQRSFIPQASVLDGDMSYGYASWNHNQFDSISPRVIKTPDSFERTSSFGLTKPATNHGNGQWLYSDSIIENIGTRHEYESTKPAGNKRPCTSDNTQASKKSCSDANGKAKPKATTSPKDPQSLVAKNRRERISERLKVLQELVPNGTKVDLVTMLEKAIDYVKFLQLQVKIGFFLSISLVTLIFPLISRSAGFEPKPIVMNAKVLAADEFWPAEGGKAPDISQVKDAIDAILSSSQRDRNLS